MSSDPTADEIDEMVGRASSEKRPRRLATRRPPETETEVETGSDGGRDDDSPAHVSEPEPERAKRKRPAPAEPAQQTIEELDVADVLPRDLPKPSENVKTLGDLNAKYNIGDSPEFKLQVWRTFPKLFPGGVKADGFYDTWSEPLTEEMVQSEYGGGTYRIAVVGPHPTKPNNTKHYDSLSLSIPGEAKHTRIPRAMQAVAGGGASADHGPMPGPVIVPQPENAKLSETAMKLAFDVADKERDERRRIEDRSADAVEKARSLADPIIQSERRRADELVQAEKERSETERRMMNERLDRERDERDRLEKKLENVMQEMQMQRSSAASELKELLPLVQRPDDSGKAAERMLESVLAKHRDEIASMAAQHQQMIESINRQHQDALSSLREANRIEVQSIRESARREVESERDAARRREERIEDQLKAEREERRRDQDRGREQLAERDQQWRDRLDQQKQSIEQSWDARHQSVVANYENRLLWQQTEIDRLKSEVSDLKSKMTDSGDPIAIVHKAKEIREAMGIPESSSSGGGGGGGIGIGGGNEDWRTVAAEGLVERVPQIIGTLGAIFGQGQPQGQPQQSQQPPPIGSVVQTPQGEMVVVAAPHLPGGVGLMPRAAYEAQQAQRALPQGQGRRRVMPDLEEMQQRRHSRRRESVSVVPNLGADLPRRRPPWEGGGEEAQPQRRVSRPQPQPQPEQQAAQIQPVPVQMQQAPQQAPMGARQLNALERQGLRVIAKLVHDSVMNADEPDEFVERVMGEWNPDVLRRVVGGYAVEDIMRGIAETAPNGAGATPEGQKFCREAFSQLKEALG